MKRIHVFLILSLVLAIMIGCGGGGGGSKQVKVSIAPESVTLLLGEEQKFVASVSGTSDLRVVWSATGGEIDQEGLYCATEEGIFEVKATSKADPSKSAAATVIVLSSIDHFLDVTAWKGTIRWEVTGSWSNSASGETYTTSINEDISREYLFTDRHVNLMNPYEYVWNRPLDSAVKVSGSINDRTDSSDGDYIETKWSGELTIVPGTNDFLSINELTKTYTIKVGPFTAEPIPTTIYDSLGDPWETWNDFPLAEIEIANQPLPLVGTTLSGSKIEKHWFETALSPQAKELDVTITWSFSPCSGDE